MTQNDNFSWQRVIAIGKFYGPKLVWQIAIYAALPILLYLLCIGAYSATGGLNCPISTCGTILSFMVYFGCLIFLNNDRNLSAQIPALPSEKLVFYIGYAVILIPLLANGLWSLALSIGSSAFPIEQLTLASMGSQLNEAELSEVKEVLTNILSLPGVTLYSNLLSIASAVMIAIIALYYTLFSKRNKLVHVLVASLLGFVAIVFLVTIASIVWMFQSDAIQALMEGAQDTQQVADFVLALFKFMFPAMLVLLAAVLVIYVVKFYKNLKHPNVA